MNTKKLLTALFSTLLIIGIAVPGPAAASSMHPAASSAAGGSAEHKSGRYQGKVGIFARIILKILDLALVGLEDYRQAQGQEA
jgi:hypothetical protein